MPFRNRRSAPLQSDKHEITFSDLAADYGAATITKLLCTGVQPAAKNISTEVGIGSKIKWFYVEFNMAAETVTNPKVVHWILIHIPGSATGVTAFTPTLYYQIGRNHIIKRGMEMLPTDVSTVYKRIFVVKVPPKYQRIGEGDQFFLNFRSTSTETMNNCGVVIYKELY